MNNVTKDLFMDIYQPVGDIAAKRPLIIFIHGGGFYQGNRKEGRDICMVFTNYGFASASIDYRLIDVPLTDSVTVAEGMIHAISDAKAAIRFFVEDAATTDTYKIDTNYIFISGGSAGGITAAQVAYLDPSDTIPNYISNLLSGNGGLQYKYGLRHTNKRSDQLFRRYVAQRMYKHR